MNSKRGRCLIGLLLLCVLAKFPSAQAYDWVYSVRKGDTLWDLCREYTHVGNCWQLIGPYNDVDFPPSLMPGTRIRFPSQWLRQQPNPVKVTFIKGSAVKISDTGQRSDVAVADELIMGMRLVVDANSSVALKFADGSTMLVESLSELRFDRLSSFGKTGMVDTRVHLLRGAVQNKVRKKREGLRFEVSTPSAVAAVRGTDFRIVADLSEETSVMRSAVYEGLVEVKNTIEKKELPENFGLVAEQNKKLPEKVKLLDPPTLKLNSDNYYPMPFELNWAKLKGARAYKIELLSQDNDSVVILSATYDKNHAILDDVEPACYALRLSGIDALMLQGMPSKQKICLAQRLAQPVLSGTQNQDLKKGVYSWAVVPEAVKYRIDIAYSESFTQAQSLWSESNSIAIEPAHKKHRYLRVTAFDKHNFSGAPSEVLKLERTSRDWSGLYIFLGIVAMVVFI